MNQYHIEVFPAGSEVDGVEISFDKKKRTLIIGGFYDRVCPIETTEVLLEDFLAKLNIEKSDISFAMKRGKMNVR